MKIAFVNQPIDSILPPYQSSVGACTYGAACSLAPLCDVIVYGSQDKHPGQQARFTHRNVRFAFFPSTILDRLLGGARDRISRVYQLSSAASSSTWHFPAFGYQVAKDLQTQECDVVHLQHCSQYAPIIRSLNPQSKIVLHLHAEWFTQNNYAVLARRLQHVDLLTAVSDYVMDKTRRLFPEITDRSATTYNGIDGAEFCREKNYREWTRRGEKRIVYAGAVSPHKGLHVLLDAFRLVVKRYPRVRLDVIGFQGTYPLAETFDLKDHAILRSVAPSYAKSYGSRLKAKVSLAPADAGTYLGDLKAKISSDIAGKVAFLGLIPRAELVDRYFSADIFAFPPIWDEGFGIPPVEAMAAGVPVVASRSGAVVETVKDRETGLLVAKNNAPELAEALLTLLENDGLRESMGNAARRRAFELFTWDGVAQTLYNRYRTLCNLDSVADLRALLHHQAL